MACSSILSDQPAASSQARWGIAGALIGYHIGVLLALGGGIVTSVVAAALGATVVLFAWRMAK
jgi:uncharacterized membrane protein YeaQ/YmgE (transglycosylase-associated protein family)